VCAEFCKLFPVIETVSVQSRCIDVDGDSKASGIMLAGKIIVLR